jgi:transcription initiation factor TFIIIB Brf1 subunit/transcription initiation factor TFIIB
MNFVYTHSQKNDVLSMIREFFKTTQIKYEQIVRFIRMNDEQILKVQYENFMKMREISTKRFVSYTSAQNDKIERFEKVLMIKIKAMRISSRLLINMRLEMIKTMSYLNNRISKKKLA